jgi:hypothetical protein
MLFKILLLFGVLLLLVAFGIRWRIFVRLGDDRAASEMLDDTFVTTNDFLWIKLFRARNRISEQHRHLVLAYFWLMAVATLLISTALVIHLAAA